MAGTDEAALGLNVDMGIYHVPGTNRTKRHYRKVVRATSDGIETTKKQRRDNTVAHRLNKTTAILDFYEKHSTRVKTCCTKNNCLVNLMGHADDSEQLSPEQLIMKDKFIRQVCASR